MENTKTKEELKVIAESIFTKLKREELPAWQCKEILLYVNNLLENAIVK